MRGQAVILSSARVKEGGGSDGWGTPDNVLDLVRKLGSGLIALDVASSADANEHVRAEEFYDGSKDRDGLEATWASNGVTFCNPPYSKLATWSEVAAREGNTCLHLVMLVPSRTDTKWWSTLWRNMSAACFVRGRLTFRGADSSAPFPSAIFYDGDAAHRFCDVFGELGHVLVLR